MSFDDFPDLEIKFGRHGDAQPHRLCMKHIALRLGADADWNSHTVLNACPQRAELNQGIWLDLQEKIEKWADKYGSVWVVCGPVIRPHAAELAGAVQSRRSDDRHPGRVLLDRRPRAAGGTGKPLVLAFIYPQVGCRVQGQEPNHALHLTNVDAIEHFTGLDFLSR